MVAERWGRRNTISITYSQQPEEFDEYCRRRHHLCRAAPFQRLHQHLHLLHPSAAPRRRHFDASHAWKTPQAAPFIARIQASIQHRPRASEVESSRGRWLLLIDDLWHRHRTWGSGSGLCWGATRRGIPRSKRRRDGRCGPVLIVFPTFPRTHRSRTLR